MLKTLLSFTIVIFPFINLSAQKIAEIKVSLNKETPYINIPYSINLDELTTFPEDELSLVEVINNQRIPTSYQIENKGKRILYWMPKANSKATKYRFFELIKGAPAENPPLVKITDTSGALIINIDNKNLLQYNYTTHYPPAGVDTAFRRSGFIHPLWTPNGQSLTRIDAPDHYHHYGLWNPWTKVLFEGETIDFWNLKDKKGTVRFANIVSLNEGSIYGDYQTLHKHVAFKGNGKEKTAMNELQTVRIYRPNDNQDYYVADITIQLNCASDSPVMLQEYRYGGLGWRATEKWNDENSETLTSDGKTRKDADGSKARWVIIQGDLDQDYGGAVMMSYPTNYNYPEPLRIWPEKSNGRGDVFANFSPTKDKDWLLKPGQNYVLKYRFLVFNGKFTKEQAEAAWQNFAYSPEISIKKFNLN
jgi:hypothetical protein